MKQGRKPSNSYELYGFIPRRQLGKHSAICKSCNRVLQNTAASRLLKHRNSCAAAIASGKRKPFPHIEVKKRKCQNITEKRQQMQQRPVEEHQVESCDELKINEREEENVSRSIKIEEEDGSIVESNGETNFEDTVYKTHEYVEPPCKFTAKKNGMNDDKVKSKLKYITEKTKYFQSELNNLKVEKTMMFLEVKKIRLEIQQLQMEN